jgi:hypothetical protein
VKGNLPYLLFQIDDDRPALIGPAEYSGRRDDDAFLFDLELTRKQNRKLCKAVHLHDSGVYWHVVENGDNPMGAAIDGYDGEITRVEMLTPPCCEDGALLKVQVTFKIGGNNDD